MKYGVSHKEDPREYCRRQSLARREKHPIGYLFSQAKYRAKIRNTEFSIRKEELEIPEYCPVFGFKLGYFKGGRQDASYSIDRLDNSIGYTKENTRVISWKANQYKGNMTIAEIEALLKYMKGI